MPPAPSLPPFAAWRHRDARNGFEVAFFDAHAGGLCIEGSTAAVEGGEPFAVRYSIELDGRWHTRSARVSVQTLSGSRAVALEADGQGRWLVDGRVAGSLDGCLDVDLEASALTNAFPVHHLGLAPAEAADAPAAYVRALDLGVERLEQRYVRIDDGTGNQCYDYTSPAFDFRCELVYDPAGLVLDYPGIATRADAQRG
ncbi:MAG: putative glycolipid-binding domain-containing protein [Solirubrobacteraceae bacterium]